MLEAAGAKNIRTFAHEDRIPGYGIHEMGSARMGSDPKKSVLNQFQQTHDVKNLFVMDAAGFSVGRVPEPDADDHGDGGAVDGLSDGADEGAEYLRSPNARCRMHNARPCGMHNAGRYRMLMWSRDFSPGGDARVRCADRRGSPHRERA